MKIGVGMLVLGLFCMVLAFPFWMAIPIVLFLIGFGVWAWKGRRP